MNTRPTQPVNNPHRNLVSRDVAPAPANLPDASCAAPVTPATESSHRTGPVVVVGPGARFLSGVSYYAARLTRAFQDHGQGGAILLLRRLCPERIYPGRHRIGTHPASVLQLDDIRHFDGLDWFWGRSLPASLRWLHNLQPSHVVLQWWTGTVAHSYVLLAGLAKVRRVPVVLEFHETLDVGEAKIPGVRRYVSMMMWLLSRLVDGVVVHSETDRGRVHDMFPSLTRVSVQVILHGPFDHLVPARTAHIDEAPTPSDGGVPGPEPDLVATSVPARPVRLLFFGVIRHYKGVDVLARAVRGLLDRGADIELVVAGEPWPDADDALAELATLPDDRVTLQLGHLPDQTISELVAAADIVVLPYRRSSASGPLHITMAAGKPVVTTSVPALVEVTDGYSGAVLCPPEDPAALADAITDASALVGVRHQDPHSWPVNVNKFETLFSRIGKAKVR